MRDRARMRYDRLFFVAAILFMPMEGKLRAAERPMKHTGSEVYIEQPPKKASEKTNSDGEEALKPVQGPVAPSGQPSTVCDPQNVSSQACYTATQQRRSIPH